MEEPCNRQCSSCDKKECPYRRGNKEFENEFTVELNKQSKVKRVIGVMSGKGGVGKSIVAAMMAVTMQRRGYNTAILDADLTGPSIPKIFGLKGKAGIVDSNIYPMRSKTGIKIISINLLMDNESAPVIWRGPLLANLIKQFWTDVVWGDIDFMFIDMPPGTGDIPLTVMQSFKIDGIIIVTTPQELVSMIVSKAINMAKEMNIPVLGIVENMSYFECPDCHKSFNVFGESKLEKISQDFNLRILAKLPIDPEFAAMCDNGTIEDFKGNWFEPAAELFEKGENNQ